MTETIHPKNFTLPLPLPPERNPLPIDEQSPPDPGLGHAIPAYGQRLVDLGELNAFGSFYRELQGDDRIILLEGCAKKDGNVDAFVTWAHKDDNNAVAQLFAGASLSHRAWEARGGKLANQVAQGQWALFQTWLASAASFLQRAIDLDPKDPEAYHRMMRVVVGDASATSWKMDDLFKKIKELRPDHLPAHMEMLTMKCEKWGGSHAEMFEFADKASASAPKGSLLHTLVPMAICERAVYYMIENDAAGANAFLRSDESRKKLANVYALTIKSEKLQETPLTPWLYNWLAAALIYSNSPEGRSEVLARMKDQVTERPWAYFSMPVYGLVNELREDFKLGKL